MKLSQLSAVCALSLAVSSSAHADKFSLAIENTLQVYKHEMHQIECLAMNIYHEARSESFLGQRAVAWVTLNRVSHSKYPNNVCDVVKQAKRDAKGKPIRNKCQFSWYCDGKPDNIKNKNAWERAMYIAHMVYENWQKRPEIDPTQNAIMYHATYVDPHWRGSYEKTVRIDDHVFYCEKV